MNELTIENLQAKVCEWAKDKGFLKPENAKAQFHKIGTELCEYYTAESQADIEDAIGDVMVTLIIYAAQESVPFEMICEKRDLLLHTENRKQDELAILYVKLAKAKEIGKDQIATVIAEMWERLEVLATAHQTTLHLALWAVLNIITKRQGTVVDGNFVKEVTQ